MNRVVYVLGLLVVLFVLGVEVTVTVSAVQEGGWKGLLGVPFVLLTVYLVVDSFRAWIRRGEEQ